MLCFSWTVFDLISLSTSICWPIMSNIIILRKCIFNHYGTSCRIFNHFELNIDPHHDQQWLTSWLTMVPIFVFEIQESTKIFLNWAEYENFISKWFPTASYSAWYIYYLSQWIKNTLELCAQNVQVKVWLKSHNRIFVFILVFCWTDMHSQMRFKKVFRTTAGNKWANRNKITLSYWHIVIHNREILHPGHYPTLVDGPAYWILFPRMVQRTNNDSA